MAEKKNTSIEVLSLQGEKQGNITLDPEIFGAPVKRRLLDLVVTGYGANQREGNASTKTRKQVRGGGKKPWRQKGTGRARHGSIRSPIWRGGGTVFGPHTRDYRVDMPKTMRLEALRSALSLRFKELNLMVVEDLKLSQPKTKELAQVRKALKLENSSVLCMVDAATENLKRASNNLVRFRLTESANVTAYDVMRKSKLVISRPALELIEKRFAGGGTEEKK